jgi:hypothetical protein
MEQSQQPSPQPVNSKGNQLKSRLQARVRGYRVEAARARAMSQIARAFKFKNPAAPAVKREAEEDWGK